MIEEKVVDLMEKLEQLAGQYAPEVMDGALGAISVTGVSQIMAGFVCLLVVFVIICVSRHFERKFMMIYRNERKDGCKVKSGYYGSSEKACKCSSLLENAFIAKWIGVAFATIMMIPAVVMMSSVWSWVAIFNPKLALAHHILGL
jgi:hypothetical protein